MSKCAAWWCCAINPARRLADADVVARCRFAGGARTLMGIVMKKWACLRCGAKLPRLADRCPECGEAT